MIVCHGCGKINPEGFNYCLECGAELHRLPEHSAESNFIMELSADSPESERIRSLERERPAGRPAAPVGSDSPSSDVLELSPDLHATPRAAPAPRPIPSQPPVAPAPMSGRASAPGLGGRAAPAPRPVPPSRPGPAAPAPSTEPIELEEVEGIELEPEPAPAATSDRQCWRCGQPLSETEKFCPSCGARFEDRPVEPGGRTLYMHVSANAGQQKALGKLVALDPTGKEGASFPLVDGPNTAGRTEGGIQFPDDRLMSPRHCSFLRRGQGWRVVDESSLNGVFIRLIGEREITSGQVFRVGQQLLQFFSIADLPSVAPPLDDGTKFWGSPIGEAWGVLSRLTNRGVRAEQFLLVENPVVLGREYGHLTFPTDAFVSGKHAKLSLQGGKFVLADLNSSNGSYLRVRDDAPVDHHDIVLIGQKLLRLDLR